MLLIVVQNFVLSLNHAPLSPLFSLLSLVLRTAQGLFDTSHGFPCTEHADKKHNDKINEKKFKHDPKHGEIITAFGELFQACLNFFYALVLQGIPIIEC